MPELQLPLLGGGKQTNLDYRDLLPVNMMPVFRNIKGDQGYLLTIDGLEQFSETSGVARGGYYNERFNKHFRVSGERLESINTDGSVDVIGVIPGNGICRFASSFNTQAILADGRLFLYDNATLTEVIDPDLGSPIDITWFRGIYVLTDGATIFQTDINDEFSISPLKFVTSEFSNDQTFAVRQTENNQVIAFNRTSIEYFYFNPNVDPSVSVLTPVQGKSVKIGIGGVNCAVEMAGTYFCLGSRANEAYKLYAISSGGQGQLLSTRHVEQILEGLSDSEIQSVYLEAQYKDGQYVLIVHLPNCTLAFNYTIFQKAGKDGAWAIFKSGVENDLYRAKFGVFDPRIGEWIYGDILENKLGKLVSDKSSQYDNFVEFEFYTPQFTIESASIDGIEIECIPGFGGEQLSTFISLSEDGAIFSQEHNKIFNKPRDYKARYIARRFGYCNHYLMYRFRFTGEIKQAFSGLKVSYG